jgi:hypothetical protein
VALQSSGNGQSIQPLGCMCVEGDSWPGKASECKLLGDLAGLWGVCVCVCVCVCVDWDVPVLWLSDHLFFHGLLYEGLFLEAFTSGLGLILRHGKNICIF